MQVRGDRGDRGGAVLLLRRVGAEPALGPLAPVADGRAPVKRLERTCVSDWSVALSCHIIQNVLNFTKVNYKNIFCNVCVCIYI
jgi:hypothetical protein